MTVLTACDAAIETLPCLDQNVAFIDKRVIPPIRGRGKRIAGTLHLSGSPRQTDRPPPTNAANA